MRAPLNFKVSMLGGLTLLTLLGCRAEQTKAPNQNITAQQTHVFTPAHVVQVEIRVVDSATALPVAEAIVISLCMGGTPYSTNSYRTDSNGIARVMSYNTFTGVSITRNGYEDAAAVFMHGDEALTNAVVKVRRIAD
jgi:hypothetical protein